MAASPTVLDSDFRYIDKKGNLLRTRTELTVAQMLTFLEEDYEYDHEITLKNGKTLKIDFKTKKGLIEVIDSEGDIEKYKAVGMDDCVGKPFELDELETLLRAMLASVN